jgi:hypothetical protein
MFEPRYHGEVQDLDTTPGQDLATGIQSSPGRINKGLTCRAGLRGGAV